MDSENDISNRANSKVIKSIMKEKKKTRAQRHSRRCVFSQNDDTGMAIGKPNGHVDKSKKEAHKKQSKEEVEEEVLVQEEGRRGITEKGEEQILTVRMSDGFSNPRDCYERDDSSPDACCGCQLERSGDTNNDKAQSDSCDNEMKASQDQQELSQSETCYDRQDGFQGNQQESLCQVETNDKNDDNDDNDDDDDDDDDGVGEIEEEDEEQENKDIYPNLFMINYSTGSFENDNDYEGESNNFGLIDDAWTIEAQDNDSDYQQNRRGNNDSSINQQISQFDSHETNQIYSLSLDRPAIPEFHPNESDQQRDLDDLDIHANEVIQLIQRVVSYEELTTQQIEIIPAIERFTIEYEEEGHHLHKQKTCSICLCEFANKEVVKQLGCDHIFHINCIDQWLISKPSCPLCRQTHK